MNKKIKIYLIMIMVAIFIISMSLEVFSAKYDFDGETVVFGQVTNAEAWEEGALLEQKNEIEEQFNVDIEITDIGIHSSEDIITSVVAGEPIADVAEVHGANFEILAAEGVLQPLDDYITEDYFDKIDLIHREAAPEYTEFLGTTYSFVGFNFPPVRLNLNMIVWNQDIFEEEGITTPYELYEQGEWTFDKFYEIAKELTKDTTGDGEVDQFGFSSQWPQNQQNVHSSFFMAAGASLTKEEDGRVEFALTDPKAIEAIELMSKLKNEDLWRYTRHFGEGKSAMHLTHRGGLTTAFESEDIDKHGIITMPRGENTDEHRLFAPAYKLVIPVGVDHDPEALIELTNALYELTSDYADMEERFEEKHVGGYSEHFVDRQDVQMLHDMYEQWIDPKYRGIMTEQEVWDSIYEVINDELSPMRVMEEIEPEIQISLDEMLDQ